MLKKLIGLIIILSISFTAAVVRGEQNRPLAEKVLRLHVIANSDDPADQALKLEVKDKIVALMHREFENVDDPEQAKRLAIKYMPEIKATAEAEIAARGYHYPVQVMVGEFNFPTKSYGNLVFPPGKYQAVRVIIGQGQGKNWWCVLFPPLCLVSSSDRGICFTNPREARVSLKCLELIPRGARIHKVTRHKRTHVSPKKNVKKCISGI